MAVQIPPRDHKDYPKVMAELARARYQSYLENAEPIAPTDGAEFSVEVLERIHKKTAKIRADFVRVEENKKE